MASGGEKKKLVFAFLACKISYNDARKDVNNAVVHLQIVSVLKMICHRVTFTVT